MSGKRKKNFFSYQKKERLKKERTRRPYHLLTKKESRVFHTRAKKKEETKRGNRGKRRKRFRRNRNTCRRSDGREREGGSSGRNAFVRALSKSGVKKKNRKKKKGKKKTARLFALTSG